MLDATCNAYRAHRHGSESFIHMSLVNSTPKKPVHHTVINTGRHTGREYGNGYNSTTQVITRLDTGDFNTAHGKTVHVRHCRLHTTRAMHRARQGRDCGHSRASKESKARHLFPHSTTQSPGLNRDVSAYGERARRHPPPGVTSHYTRSHTCR